MIYDNDYFSQYSAPLISFRNRRASQSEFDQYWAKKEPVKKEEITASIKSELAMMPSVDKPAGLDYYLQLHYKLLDSFCKDVAEAMITKSHDPASVKFFSKI